MATETETEIKHKNWISDETWAIWTTQVGYVCRRAWTAHGH